MTLGTSLFLIFLGVVLILLFRFIHKNKKWKSLFKITGVLIFLSTLIGLSIWGWYTYQERPYKVTELGKVSLGMTPVEVTLALGKPSYKLEPKNDNEKRIYFYADNYKELQYAINFTNSASPAGEKVESICTFDSYVGLFGFRTYSSETEILEKLGKPNSESINKDGLSKFINYPNYNSSFQISEGKVESFCISVTGVKKYLEEYGQ